MPILILVPNPLASHQSGYTSYPVLLDGGQVDQWKETDLKGFTKTARMPCLSKGNEWSFSLGCLGPHAPKMEFNSILGVRKGQSPFEKVKPSPLGGELHFIDMP